MSAYARRYARAFADVVLAHRLDPLETSEELSWLLGALGLSAQLRSVWESPAIPGSQKIKLLDALGRHASISKETRNFLAVLIEHNRIKSLGEISRQFQQEIDQRLGFAEADVTSARDLDSHEKSILEGNIAVITGKKVRARYSRDPNLLGGAVVTVGSTTYDGSLRGQLERLRRELSDSRR